MLLRITRWLPLLLTKLRFSVSNDGTAFETLTKNLTNITTRNLDKAWGVLGSVNLHCHFYQEGFSLGTFVGTKTAIHDNASRFYVGANKGASTVGNFFNGKMDDVRIWNTTRTDSQMLVNKDVELGELNQG
jgi:hypothetical protein